MAKQTFIVTEDDLEQQFTDDKKAAVELLDAEYRERIWRYIRSVCRYFTDDDIHDVYQSALAEFIRCVKRPDFEPSKPLRLMQRIAKFRAIDLARKKNGNRARSAGALIEALAEDLRDTRIGIESRLMMRDEWPKFRQAMDKAIDALPPKQRAAALAFVEVYEVVREERSCRALAARIREVTGEDCTVEQASDNWRAAKKSIEAKLRRQEFHLLIEE